MGVFNAKPGPGPCFWVHKLLCLAFPNFVFGFLRVGFGFCFTVKDAPLRVLFTHAFFTEPTELIQNIRRFRRAVFARLVTARFFTNPGGCRGFTRHAAAASRVFLLGRRHGHIESEGIWFRHSLTFSTRSGEFNLLGVRLKGAGQKNERKRRNS